MASTEDILAEINAFLNEPATPSTAGVSTVTPSSSSLGADLLGNLDTTYANRPSPFAPTTLDIVKEALPTWETTKNVGKSTLEGLYNVARYANAYNPMAPKLWEIQALRAESAQRDEQKRIELGLSPDQYAELKSKESNKGYRHLGGQIVGGTGGAGAGGIIGGTVLGGANTLLGLVFPPALAAVPYTTALGTALGGGVGGYFGAGTGDVGVQAIEEKLGWSPETTALEKARMFREAGTSGAIGELLPSALAAGYKGTVKAGQTGRAILGPTTLDKGIATAYPMMQAELPSGVLAGKYARQAGQEQVAGLKTSADIMGTQQAAQLEQNLGLNPQFKDRYSQAIRENIVEGQKFILNDMTKEAKVAATASADDVTKKLLRQKTISDADIGDVVKTTIEKESKVAGDVVKEAYAKFEKDVATDTSGVKAPIEDAINAKYPPDKVEKLNKSGQPYIVNETSRLVPAPIRALKKTINDGMRKGYTVGDLHNWSVIARETADKLARQGDKKAAEIAGDIRGILTDKIKSTVTGKKDWSAANEAARVKHDLFENHKLGKSLDDKFLNDEDYFKKITSGESNFKNFLKMVPDDSPVLASLEAKAISDLKALKTQAGESSVAAATKRAKYIDDNRQWLDPLWEKLGKRPTALNELEDIGSRRAVKLDMTNPLGGSPTQARSAASQTKIGELLRKGVASADPEQAARQTWNAILRRGALAVGSSASGLALGGPVGAAAGLLTGGLLGKALAVRIGKGNKNLLEGAYKIMMNPKIAAYEAPRLAKALAAEKAASIEAWRIAGKGTGQLGRAGVYAGRLSPAEKESVPSEITFSKKTSVHDEAANAAKEIEQMLQGQSPAAVAESVKTPKVIGAKRVNAGDAHLATKPPIIQAMAMAESAGNDKAVSPKGARGRMQLMPATAKELGVKNIHDPIENIDAGERYFNRYAKKYGDERIALIAYNWGPGRVENIKKRFDKRGIDLTWSNIEKYASLPTETENYITRVLKNKQKLMRA